MNRLLMWLLETSITTAFLALVATFVSSLFARRPAIQHLIWFAVLLKFVLPPVIAWPASAQSAVRGWIEGWAAPAVTPAVDASPAVAAETIHVEIDVVAESAGFALADWLTVSSIQIMLLVVWAAGMAIVVYRQLRRIRECQSILCNPVTAPAFLLDEVRDLSNGFGMRSVPVQVVGRIASPFVWCFGWLRLVWPQSLTSPADVMRSRSILAHELGHVRRGDHWIAWIELVASLAWWWNPVFWFVRNRLRESAEMSCDAMALSVLPDERLAYAELFLELSSSSKPGVPVPVLGVSTGTPSSFERRLTMILSEGVSGKLSPWGICVAMALLGFGMPSLSQGEQKEFENTERKTGNVIYLVDDDGDGVADRPATIVESEFIDGDPTLGKVYFVVDTDAEGRKTRRKVTIIHSKSIENGIVIHTLGRLIVKVETAPATKAAAVEQATEFGLEVQTEKSVEKHLRLESELQELRSEYDRLRERYRAEAAVREQRQAQEVERREASDRERQALQELEVEARVRELHNEVERLSRLIERTRPQQHDVDVDTIRKRTVLDKPEDLDPRKEVDSRRLRELEKQKATLSDVIKKRAEVLKDREKLDVLEGRTRDDGKKREALRFQVEYDRKVSPEGIVTPSASDSKPESETLDEPREESPKAKLDVKKARVKEGDSSAETNATVTDSGVLKQFRMRRDVLAATKSTASARDMSPKLDIVLKLTAPEEGDDATHHLSAFESTTGRQLWSLKLDGKATRIEDVNRLDSSLIVRFDQGARLRIDAKTGKVLEKSDSSSREEVKELEIQLRSLREQLQRAEGAKP